MQAVCSAQRPVAALQRRAVRASSSSSAFVGSSMRRAPLRVSSRPAARQVTVMGLFGLGVPELAVIAGVAALIFGAWVWGGLEEGCQVMPPLPPPHVAPAPVSCGFFIRPRMFAPVVLFLQVPASCLSWARAWARL